MPRINTIGLHEAEGKLKEIYEGLLDQRGKLAAVHTIQSLRPESIRQHMDLYMGIMFSRSELTRAEREMMGVVVSRANGCTYCQQHHAEALHHYWKDYEKIQQLLNEDTPEFLSDRERVLCRYARTLTIEPQTHEKQDFTRELKTEGLGDGGILDASLVVAYFNFVNRMVLSLGVELEADQGKGYKY